MNSDDLSISGLWDIFLSLQSHFRESSQDNWYPKVNSQLPLAWEIGLHGHVLTISSHPSIGSLNISHQQEAKCTDLSCTSFQLEEGKI